MRWDQRKGEVRKQEEAAGCLEAEAGMARSLPLTPWDFFTSPGGFSRSQRLGTLGSSWNLCVFANSQSQLLKRLHLRSQRKKTVGNLLRGLRRPRPAFTRVSTSGNTGISPSLHLTGTTLMCDLHLCFSKFGLLMSHLRDHVTFRHIQMAWCMCVLSRFRHVQLFATLWTVAHQDPLVHGSLYARILEGIVMPSSRGSNPHLLWLLHCR